MNIKRLLLLAVLSILAVTLFQIGCDELITEQTTIIEAGHPIADFTLTSPADGFCCVPCVAVFLDLSDGPRQIYQWNFGDGTVVTETLPSDLSQYTAPTHTYEEPGIYTVSLKITDTAIGGEDTEIHERFIYVGSISADFDATPSPACVGEEVDFTLHEYSNLNTYKWVFGDGDGTDTTTGLNPSHVYDAEGTYTVTLIAEDNCGQTVGTVDIEVGECPDVDFAADVTQGCAPLEVAFTNSTNIFGKAFVSREWDFGDGETDTAREPVHLYATGGLYTVSLTVTSSAGTSTLTMPDYIDAGEITLAAFGIEGDASFCYSPTQDFQVNFVNQSLGILDSVRWYFGDGETETATDPIHIYTTPGIYSVTLEAYGLCGADTAVRNDYIVLSDVLLDENVVLDAVLLTGDGTVPSEYGIADVSTVGVVTGRKWTVDGVEVPNTTDLLAIQYTFDTEGTHTVALEVSNDCGTATNSIDIVITAPQ